MKNITHIATSYRAIMGCLFVFALVVGVSAIAPQASAQATNITVSPNLTIGSRGADVVTLQALMSEMGYLNVPVGVPLGYYGSLTRSAVASYQASQNVAPAVGYYGPLTKNALFSDFSSRGWTRLLGWSY